MSPKLEINNSVLLHLILWVGLLPWLLRRKASTHTAGDLGLIPGSGRSPAEGNGNPLQYSCLEKPMDGGAWWATIHGVSKSQTRLSEFTFFLSCGSSVPNHIGWSHSCSY